MTRSIFPHVHRGSVTADPKFCCDFILDGSDPLFARIGRAFIEAQIAEYGTDHVYNCDTFNENAPPTDDPAYIAAIAESTFEGMRAADADVSMLAKGFSTLRQWKIEKSPDERLSVPSIERRSERIFLSEATGPHDFRRILKVFVVEGRLEYLVRL